MVLAISRSNISYNPTEIVEQNKINKMEHRVNKGNNLIYGFDKN